MCFQFTCDTKWGAKMRNPQRFLADIKLVNKNIFSTVLSQCVSLHTYIFDVKEHSKEYIPSLYSEVLQSEFYCDNNILLPRPLLCTN